MSTPDREPAAEVFDLLCLLVSSARGALEEGVYTASLRLIHAAERLAAVAAQSPALGGDQARRRFFEHTAAEIHAGATTSYLDSAAGYQAFLDRAVRSVATEIRHDNGL
jgi:hypothetical protein